MRNVRYMYVRNSRRERCGCIAISVKRDDNSVEYSYSVRNPIDGSNSLGDPVKFDKKEAKLLATKRLVESPHKIPIAS